MSAPMFVRLGPGPTSGKVAYAAIVDLEVVHRVGGRDDDEAITLAREYFGGELECEPGLGEAARRAHIKTRPLTPAETFVKAREAAPLLAPAEYRNCPDDAAIIDLWEAARAFARALANETRPEWYIAAKASGTFDDEPIEERELFLLVQTSPLTLRVFDRGVADAMFATPRRVPGELDHLVLDLIDGPPELRTMIADGIGLDAVPRVRAMSKGEGSLVDDATYALVCACTAAIVRHVAANARGVRYEPLLGGQLVVELMSYVEPEKR